MNERNSDIKLYESRKATDNSWGTTLDPFSISSQMKTLIGSDVKAIKYRNKNKIDKDLAETYKQLVYDNDLISE